MSINKKFRIFCLIFIIAFSLFHFSIPAFAAPQPPVITISEEILESHDPITGVTITVIDDIEVLVADVVVSAETNASYENFSCVQTSDEQVNCTIDIINTGTLIITAIDNTDEEGTGEADFHIVKTPLQDIPETNGKVYASVYDENTGLTYIGGDFEAIGEETRMGIAAFDGRGALVDFDPNVSGDSDDNVYALAISLDGETLYAGGDFNMNGNTNVASFDLTDDGAMTSFKPEPNDIVKSFAFPSGGVNMYIGGYFTTIGEVDRNYIALLNADTGVVDLDFDAEINNMGGSINAIAINRDDDVVYAGGDFNTIGEEDQERTNLAGFNVDTGALEDFAPNPDNEVYALAFSSDTDILYIGGDFDVIGEDGPSRLAAVNTSGTLVDFGGSGVDRAVRTLVLSEDKETLYVGGDFRDALGTPFSKFVSLEAASGLVINTLDFAPSPNVYNISIRPDGHIINIGGDFTIIGLDGERGNYAEFYLIEDTTDPEGAITAPTTTSTEAITDGTFTMTDDYGITASTISSDVDIGHECTQTSAVQVDCTFTVLSSADVTISFRDDAGNEGSSNTVTYTINSVTVPILSVSAASSVTQTTATLNGNITATGGANATARGFNYGLTDSYGTTTSESGSFSTGGFSGNISGLTCATTYHYRSSATNSAGTGVSSDTTFTTSACSSSGGGGFPPPPTYVCKDPTATNYQIFGLSTPSLCRYTQINIPVVPTLGIEGACKSTQILTQNLRSGVRNGKYDSFAHGTVKEVKILQAHLNRLGFQSGKVDGILGPITDGAIKRMQKFLGTKQDGLVGPITRGLVNNSCADTN